MADLNSTIIHGNLRVTENINSSNEIRGQTLYESGVSLVDKYQPKGNYLTSHQDISGKLNTSGGDYSVTIGGATSNSNKTLTVNGKFVINPSYNTANNSYNEGFRVNSASNGWAEIAVGGSSNTTSGTESGLWIIGKRGAAGSTSGSTGDFTIEHNGSSGTGLTLYANGNVPTWNGVNLATQSWVNNKGYLTSHQDISGKADKVSMTAGTYKRVTVNSQGIVTAGDNVDANDNTWRPIAVGGTNKLTDSSTTLNFAGSGATSVSYSNGTITISSTDNNTNYYHTRIYSSGLKISTGTGVSDMYVPTVSSSNAGLVPQANSGDPSDGTYVLTSSGGTVAWTAGKLTDTNTWRGIQDNLTSSTNTTESLSAKQGYLLANGSARDSTKLPLAGGTIYSGNGSAPLSIKSYNNSSALLGFKGSNDTVYGYIGANSSKKPIFYDGTNTTEMSLEGHTHNYAGSSSAGGAATSANKINTDAGSATQPVYFSSGVPVACTYSLSKSVPSDAKFTDTTYESKTAASGGTAVSLVTTGEKYTWNNKANSTHEHSYLGYTDLISVRTACLLLLFERFFGRGRGGKQV